MDGSANDTRLTRRRALQLGLGAAALPALAGTGAFPAAASAPMLGPARPDHYRFRMGGFECTLLSDGAVQLDGPHPIFGQNVSEEEMAKLMAANFLPRSRFEIAFTPLLVNTGSELVLFDTGNGPAGRKRGAGRLLASLKNAGYAADQVDVVVITHCHPDHIGGLLEAALPAFPKARYAIARKEYDFWTGGDAPKGRSRVLVRRNVVPLAEKFTFLEPDDPVVAGIQAIEAFGHTPGHMAFLLESDGEFMLLFADTTNHFVASLQKPDWHVRFDMDKEKAAATRKRILEMAARERWPVTGYHMPFPAVGYIEKTASAYRWVPASYQFSVV